MRRPSLLGLALALAACSDRALDTKPSSTSPSGSACTFDGGVEADPPVPAIHTPRWVFEPWISKDISTSADTYAFVGGFRDRDIPVGVVVLDSPWESNYNTFIPNPSRYPAFQTLVSDMHAKSVRLVVWMTAFVNQTSFDLEEGGDTYASPSPNLPEGLACNFFVDDGHPYGWWKGAGASLDFMNPAARAWWHRQEDAVLALGIDGFKLDFGESYVSSDPVTTAMGPVAHQVYSEAYYRDFFVHTQHVRGPDFVNLTRAYDKSYSFPGRFFAKPENSAVAWMGDNRRDYVGLTDALDEIFRSAKAGYVVLGSDIGGYLDRDDVNLTEQIPFDPVVFARWTAIGALSPFMQLHGRANITPWTVPQTNDQITKIYRYWAKLHHAMVPFFYSAAASAYAGGAALLRPIGDEAAWTSDYRFQLGDALLVAPLLDATGKRDVALPSGAAFYDWWAPAADAIPGGTTLKAYDATDLRHLPLFVRAGAILPLEIEDDTVGLGTSASKGKLTVLVYPDTTKTSFDLTDTDEAKTHIDAERAAGAIGVNLSRAVRDTLVRVRVDAAPASVAIDGVTSGDLATRAAFDAAESGWFSEPATRSIWVKIGAGAKSHSIHAT